MNWNQMRVNEDIMYPIKSLKNHQREVGFDKGKSGRVRNVVLTRTRK